MQSLQQFVERIFDRGNAILEHLSAHWREHGNRRTIFVLIVGGSIALVLYLFVIQPPENFPIGTLVTIPEGTSFSEATLSLEQKGVVRSRFALQILVALSGHARNIHAGDYIFKEPKSLFSIARAISVGAYGLEPLRIRVPEGATTKEMAVLFAGRLERFDTERFLATAQPQEGYLFPDTYFFLPNADDTIVYKTLRQNFDTQIVNIEQQIASSTRSLSDIVIMASLLEREARNTKDRRMIAGVLWNRIDRGMLLQVDAAFLYTLGKGTFDLTVADLQSDSPYNTYKYKGLPPGAIGSPSLDSLLAAATPTKSDYLFYLADNKHVTHYSKTYEEHLRKKRLYLGN